MALSGRFYSCSFQVISVPGPKGLWQRKTALNSWVATDVYNPVALNAAISSAFYHIYTYPIFSLRAMLRSLQLSVIVTILMLLLMRSYHIGLASLTDRTLILFFFANILSDYLSLFIVRAIIVRLFAIGIYTMLIAPIGGAVVIGIVYYAMTMLAAA